jgi:ankyrin repeat protein
MNFKGIIASLLLLLISSFAHAQPAPYTASQREDLAYWAELHDAIRNGDIKEINKYWKLCLKRNIDPFTAIHDAETVATVRMLEAIGVDMTKRYPVHPFDIVPDRNTLIESACFNGFYDVAVYLVSKYPSLVNEIDIVAGRPLLHTTVIAASFSFSLEVQDRSKLVRLLLSHGALVDEMARDGETALMAAAIRGQINVFKVLLDAGASDDMKNNKGESVDDYIRELEKREDVEKEAGQIKKMLTDARAKRASRAQNSDDNHAQWLKLKQAIEAGAVEEIKKQWAECQKRNIDTGGAILSARTPETVKLLEDLGADIIKAHPMLPMGRSPYAITLIYAACRDGNKDLVEYLLGNNKIDVKQTDERWQRSLLHITMAGRGDENERLEIVRLLLAKGANVDALDCTGKTPLFLAVAAGDFKSFQELLHAGASYSIIDNGWWSIDKHIEYYSRFADKPVRDGIEKIKNLLEARRAKQTIPGNQRKNQAECPDQ